MSFVFRLDHNMKSRGGEKVIMKMGPGVASKRNEYLPPRGLLGDYRDS